MTGLVIALIIVAALAVIAAIVVPLVVALMIHGDPAPMVLRVQREGGPDTFDSVAGGETRTFVVTVTRDEQPVADLPLLLQRTLANPDLDVYAANGAYGAIDEYLGQDVEINASLCVTTDADGSASFTWHSPTGCTRNNQDPWAWLERLTWSAASGGGTCAAPVGPLITRAMTMTPDSESVVDAVFVSSAAVDSANDRIVIQFTSLDAVEPNQDLAVAGTGGVVAFNDGAGFISTSLTIAPGNGGVVYANFAAGELDDIVIMYPGCDTNSSLPLAYTSSPGNTLTNIESGAVVPSPLAFDADYI